MGEKKKSFAGGWVKILMDVCIGERSGSSYLNGDRLLTAPPVNGQAAGNVDSIENREDVIFRIS